MTFNGHPFVDTALVHVPRYSRQFHDFWISQGPRGVSERFRAKVAQWLSPKSTTMEVGSADVLAADLSKMPVHEVPELRAGHG